MPKDPLKRVSPLYRNTEKESPQEQSSVPETETEATIPKVPEAETEATIPKVPNVVITEPMRIETPDLPPGPPVRRKKTRGFKFSELYTTRSLSIDNRILDYFDDFIEAGAEAGSKTAFANQILLKMLREAGYQIPIDIFSQPVRKQD
jgi:hypothetical protein